MTDKEFYNIFKEKLAEHGEPVDDALWESIGSSLDKAGSKKAPLFIFPRIKRTIAVALTSAAVVLVSIFILSPNQNQPDIQVQEAIALAEKPVYSQSQSEDASDAADDATVYVPAASWGFAATQSGIVAKTTGAHDASTSVPSQILTDTDTTDVVVEARPENPAVPSKEDGRRYSADRFGYNDFAILNEQEREKPAISIDLKSGFLTGGGNDVMRRYTPDMAVSGNGKVNMPIDMISDAEYSLPLTVGLQLQIRINRIFAVGLGLNYSMLRSKYEGLMNAKFYNVKQTLHYIGVPVNAYITLTDSRYLYGYANGGFSVEKGLRANYKMTDHTGHVMRKHSKISGLQYSANIGLGLEFKFSDNFGLYVEPNLVCFFNSDVPASIRTDEPLQFRGDVGFRFHLR